MGGTVVREKQGGRNLIKKNSKKTNGRKGIGGVGKKNPQLAASEGDTTKERRGADANESGDGSDKGGHAASVGGGLPSRRYYFSYRALGKELTGG